MGTLWFLLVAFMSTAYVVLDGFDLGAGAVSYLVAKTPDERRLILRAIGPVWDGNEVWLLAAGGTLYFSFPVLYASSFSGFYLPLMMVLWLLMLRGMGIELRGHVDNPMWHGMWDFVFSAASALLAIFFGAALGNVVRGVPLNADGYFFEPLWTNFSPTAGQTGILDWYTVLTGVVALVVLGTHGANYVASKTEGDVNARARRVGAIGTWAIVVLTVLSFVATVAVRPQVLDNYRAHMWGAIFPLAVAASIAAMVVFRAKGRDTAAFFSSCAYIVAMLGGAAFALYPTLLPSSTDPAFAITIDNAAAPAYGLGVGIVWWCIGIALALGYFTYLYRSFRGKVVVE